MEEVEVEVKPELVAFGRRVCGAFLFNYVNQNSFRSPGMRHTRHISVVPLTSSWDVKTDSLFRIPRSNIKPA